MTDDRTRRRRARTTSSPTRSTRTTPPTRAGDPAASPSADDSDELPSPTRSTARSSSPPSATSSRTSPCACRPTSRTTASGCTSSSPPRSIAPPARLAEALLPVLDAVRGGVPAAPRRGRAAVQPDAGRAAQAGSRDDRPSRTSRSIPIVAEAVHHEPGDGGDAVVAEVLRTGYRGRAARCARRWSTATDRGRS